MVIVTISFGEEVCISFLFLDDKALVIRSRRNRFQEKVIRTSSGLTSITERRQNASHGTTIEPAQCHPSPSGARTAPVACSHASCVAHIALRTRRPAPKLVQPRVVGERRSGGRRSAANVRASQPTHLKSGREARLGRASARLVFEGP